VSVLELDLMEVAEYAEGGPQSDQFITLLSDLRGELIETVGVVGQVPDADNQYTVLINEAGPGSIGMAAFQVDEDQAGEVAACNVMSVQGTVANLQRYPMVVMVLLGGDVEWSCKP
jgi:hypothetical protein